MVRRELLIRLAKLPLFAGLDATSLSDLADAMNWLALPGGTGAYLRFGVGAGKAASVSWSALPANVVMTLVRLR